MTSYARQETRGAEAARKLSLLGMLLLALHPLFAITAVMGMYINHTQADRTRDTPYESHRRWQLGLFWVALASYALTFSLWRSSGSMQALVWTGGLVYAALAVNLLYWIQAKKIPLL